MQIIQNNANACVYYVHIHDMSTQGYLWTA